MHSVSINILAVINQTIHKKLNFNFIFSLLFFFFFFLFAILAGHLSLVNIMFLACIYSVSLENKSFFLVLKKINFWYRINQLLKKEYDEALSYDLMVKSVFHLHKSIKCSNFHAYYFSYFLYCSATHNTFYCFTTASAIWHTLLKSQNELLQNNPLR